MEYIAGLKKSLIVIFCISFLLVVFLLISFNNSFFENKFVVTFNDQNINARYYSKYSELLLVKRVSEGRLNSYSYAYDLLNKTYLSDKYTLDLKEYEIYDRFGHRESYSPVSSNVKTEIVEDSNVDLKIERMDKVLYEGPFISDVTDFISEEGRYYFHIYVKSKRSTTPIARVNTTLTFNVLVVGYEN